MSYADFQRLLRATVTGDEASLSAFLQTGGDPNLATRSGNTLLMEAAHYKQVGISRLLIEHGADVNALNRAYEGPLCFALKMPATLPPLVMTPAGAVGFPAMPPAARDKGAMFDLVCLLVERGAEVNPVIPLDEVTLRTRARFRTPLQLAIEVGSGRLTRWLLDQGADIDGADINGATALMSAIQEGQIAIARELVAQGTDVRIRHNKGLTALHCALERIGEDMEAFRYQAAQRGRPLSPRLLDRQRARWMELLSDLIEAGADHSALDLQGIPMLFYVIDTGDAEIARHMFALGTDSNAITRGQVGPLHHLARHPSLGDEQTLALARVLIEEGSAPERLDSLGQTPTQVAAANGRPQLAAILAGTQIT